MHSTSSDSINVSIDGAIACVLLNRPDRLNALDGPALDQLAEAVGNLTATASIRSLLLTGAGRGFCAGGDLAARPPIGDHDTEVRALRRRVKIVETLLATPVVSIAAINGACAGMGLALAAACDLRVAAEQAVFATGYLRAGLPGDFGGMWLLTRLLGSGTAKDWFLRPRRLTAAEAAQAGFLSDVVPLTALLPTAEVIARAIVESDPEAVRAMKANSLDASESLADYLDTESDRHVRVRNSQRAVAAAGAIVGKP
jgi:2-(1,2-epoxy-1,2-dihydrophenyl)acetyl-CoA isomerase